MKGSKSSTKNSWGASKVASKSEKKEIEQPKIEKVSSSKNKNSKNKTK